MGGAMCLALVGATSCTDYLDKAPESDIAPEDAFKNFNNFQGFTEELYSNQPDPIKGYWSGCWNWGEDEILVSGCNYLMSYKIDNGDFWGWQAEFDGWQAGWMDKNKFSPNLSGGEDGRLNKGMWPCAWYGIRKCNIGLENLDLLVDATAEQKKLIEGQLRFFRAWYHFQLVQFFGPLAYVEESLPAGSFELPRPDTYAEVADKIAEDFRKAADLLPIDWDKTESGIKTYGNNERRINKIMALGYLGKNYLWAASPLMANYTTNYGTTASTGAYDVEYCKKAAEAFAELLTLTESGATQYALVPFEDYKKVFLTHDGSALQPGSTEAIFRTFTSSGWQNTRYGIGLQFGSKQLSDEAGPGLFPTANYIDANYGMANGLPINAEGSGWDPSHPWKGRDPRYYHDITFDGCRIRNTGTTDGELYCDMQPVGDNLSKWRSETEGTRTGFLTSKFTDVSFNKADDGYSYSSQAHISIAWMRLADIYLMFAEAANEAYGPKGKVPNTDLTAESAINALRDRAKVEFVDARYTGSADAFRPEIRRERAVELAFEGHRFNDLRRWVLLDKPGYIEKTSIDFRRAGEMDYLNPSENAVTGYKQVEILKRNFTAKHYWLPLKKKDCNISSSFKQNPGW